MEVTSLGEVQCDLVKTKQEDAGDRAYKLSLLSEKTRMCNYLQMS